MDNRKKIYALKELRNYINLNKKIWSHIFTTNCYAYALGLDIPENKICDYAYVPGNISNAVVDIVNEYFKYDDLVFNLYHDLEYLGIDFRMINPNDKISADEWKIALYTASAFYDNEVEYLQDFHFLRQNSAGIWFHKQGWSSIPTNRDNHLKVIRNLDECYFSDYEYKACYSLKIKI